MQKTATSAKSLKQKSKSDEILTTETKKLEKMQCNVRKKAVEKKR